ncbi:chalcone isomerase family protein [Shewanella intestini]|uniref:Chalcone isomerase n=1 Tax=Shewanella intestini TaxID=2017544 RepID=A0ABS5HYM6_9GAMM|nr:MULTISPECIES: chalcone isomerase family protein [Shewanella]MBR9726741.1 chalcone isomerase [Shewanella intestini]MRG34693.1 chalcone isomerase [Shewanella sp. XMDDZSB0408]
MKKLIPLGAVVLSVISPVQAKEVAGVDVAETLVISGTSLHLNGAGVRSKFFMDLYVGSLYLQNKQTQLTQVLQQPQAVVRLNITSGMITSEKMTDAITEGFELATDDNAVSIEQQVNAFMAFFVQEIKKGDQFTFVTSTTMGVMTFKNGQELGVIKGESFRQALLKIWLGDEPAQKSLRKAMLDQ